MPDGTAELDQITATFREALNDFIGIHQKMLSAGASPELAQAALSAKLLDLGLNAEGLAGLLVAAIARIGTTEEVGT